MDSKDTIVWPPETVGSLQKKHKLKRVRLNGTNENDDIGPEQHYIAYISDTEMYAGEFYRTPLGWRFRGKKLQKGTDERIELMLSLIRNVYRIVYF